MKRLIYLSLAALMVLAVSCKKEPKVGTPSVITLAATEVEAFSARLNAKIDFAGVNWGGVNYGFYWGTSEDQEGTYTMGEGVLGDKKEYSAKITGLTPETEYWFKAFAEIDGEPFAGEILHFTTAKIPVPEAVDLGIVVNGKKIKWGSFNLGATKPEEYGYYYAWGETTPKDEYSWSTYKFGTSESGPFSKYNSVDNNTVLDSGPEGDDVASKLLGSKWRMPTEEEWNELKTRCTWAWTTENGVKGRKATGSNGNSIFLPAAGYWDTDSVLFEESFGLYWSSALHSGDTNTAWYVYFYSSSVNSGNRYRCNGLPVRPVWEE